MNGVEARPRLGWAVGVSTAAHLVALLLMARWPRPAAMSPVPHLELIPIALLGNPGGGNDGGAPGPVAVAPAPEPPPAPSPIAAPAPVPPPRPTKPVVNRPKVAPKAVPPPSELAARPAPHRAEVPAVDRGTASTGSSTGVAGGHGAGTEGTGSGAGSPGSGGGRGGGSGGGDGTGDARVAYAANPRPEYPLLARRMGMEGVVLLGVLVRSDGSVGEIDVQQSSGSSQLDDAALRTVRTRWRFVPARKGGTAIDARVTVPIRFRLSDES